MKGLFLFISLTTLLHLSSAEVIPIDILNHDDFLTYSKWKPHLAVFYTDWNDHCKIFMKNLNQITVKFPKLTIFTIKCDEDNSALCEPNNMTYLPQLEFYSKGTVKRNTGALSINTVKEWLQKLHGAPYERLRSEKDVEKMRKWMRTDFAVLIHKGNAAEDKKKTLRRLAYQHAEKIRTYFVEDAGLIDNLGLKDKADGLYMLRNAKRAIVPITIESPRHFREDLIKHRYRKIKNLTKKDWENIQVDQHKLSLIMFDQGCSRTEKQVLRRVYTFYKLKQLNYYKISPKSNSELLATIGSELGAPSFCNFIIAHNVNPLFWRKFLFAEYFNLDSIHSIMEKLNRNKLPVYYKSKHNSQLGKDELNCYSFSDTLNMLSRDLFVLFYKSRSKEIDRVQSYLEVMESMTKENGFDMRMVDLDHNDIQEFMIEQEPVIMFFTPRDDYNQIQYDGEITQEKLDEFVKHMEETSHQ